MKKLFLFAAVAGFGLCSASQPNNAAHHPREARAGYPPCSRTVTDSCIQLRERGVRTPANLARNRRAGPSEAHASAAPAPVRTAQAAAGVEGCRCAPPRRPLTRRVRQAGERG